ncbi:MAG: hypothetical protein HQ511_01135 [Rhodospirillales bacterium]|nr:hypothetical protein [Rhodospirillales bacterium]
MSIFAGTDEIIFSALGLGPGETLDHKSTCRRLGSTPLDVQAISTLVSDLYRQVETNWSDRTPSRENWRVERRITASPKNKSPEVLLEQSISLMSEQGFLDGWYNQIPVASGLIDGFADKRAAVDLLQFDGESAALVELKWDSNNPAFAAFEILRYGLAFLFCYLNRDKFGYADKPLMAAKQVSLRVLAPHNFYNGYDLPWLGRGLDQSLRAFAATATGGALTIDFAFTSFPQEFDLPPFRTGAEVASMRDLPADADPCRRIVAAVGDIKAVWAA